MRGKQAKILSQGNLEDLLLLAEISRYPLRNTSGLFMPPAAWLGRHRISTTFALTSANTVSFAPLETMTRLPCSTG
jgi:hypothetical protein